MKKYCLVVMMLLSFNLLMGGEKIKIGVDQGNPPFMYGVNGKAVGIYPAILTEIFKNMNVDFEIKTYPWKRLLDMGANNELGIGGIYKNPAREKIYDYSEEIFPEKVLIYTRSENKFDYTNISDLYGRRVGVLLGWSYGKEFDDAVTDGKIIREEITSDLANFKKLDIGRLDCLLALEMTGNLIIEQERLSNIQPLETPLNLSWTYLVFNKKSNKIDFLKAFNLELAKIKKNGKFDEIVKKSNASGK